MQKIIFVNRFYWPDEPATSQLLTDLAAHLSRGKHCEVYAIASRPTQPLRPRFEVRDGVHIMRVGGRRLGSRQPAGRIFDFFRFICGALWQLVKLPRRGDKVVFMTDPPLLATIAWPLLRCRGIPFIHWVQDIYPEIAVELTRQRWLNLLLPARNVAWRQAAACVTLGPGMAGVISRGGVSADKIRIIPNWAPDGIGLTDSQSVETLRANWNLTGKFVALYSGNLGHAHDLEPIIKVATRLNDNTNIVFVFVGAGAQLESLKSQARGLTNVRFYPAQPRAQLAATLALGDIHFVTLRAGCQNYVFPSKFYGIIAASRPLIYIGPAESDLARLIAAHQLGRNFTSKQHLAMAETLEELQGNHARLQVFIRNVKRYANTQGPAACLEAWVKLLGEKQGLAANSTAGQSDAIE